jgi:uncharacterized membrane protein
MNKGLSNFFNLMGDFTKVQSVAFKGAVLVPLVCIWTKLGPPQGGLANTVLSLLALIALICVFMLFFERGSSTQQRWSLCFALLFFFAAAGSVYFFQRYTLPVDGKTDRVVIGTELQVDVARLMSPVYSPNDALRDSGFDPEKVWTPDSVQKVRLFYELDWVLTLVFFTAAIAIFVMSQTNNDANRAGPG